MKHDSNRFLAYLAVFAVIALASAGCNKAYFNAMKTMGYNKHGLLVGKVKDVRNTLAEANKQFQTSLKVLTEVTNSPTNDVDSLIKRLNGELDHSESTAKIVHKKISDVETAARDVLQGQAKEVNKLKDEAKRLQKRRDLERDRADYFLLLESLRRAESMMTPVLIRLRTQILYVNRDPTARSIAYLKSGLGTMENDVTALVREMNQAVAQCDAFIKARRTQA